MDICRAAINALSRRASGAFSVDLKENRAGLPCITEINAGRFFIGMTAFDQISAHGTATTFVALALNDPVALSYSYVTRPDYYVVRDLDILPGVFSAEDLFKTIARWDARPHPTPGTPNPARSPIRRPPTR